MYPDLLTLGPFTLPSFGLLVGLGFLLAGRQLGWNLRFLKIGTPEDAEAIVLASLVAGMVGARLYYALLHSSWSALIGRAGFGWYGGFLAASLAVLLVCRVRRLPVVSISDAVAPSLALGYAVGRLGCFMVGDDYGVPTSMPWAVAFPEGAPPSTAANLRAFGVDVPAAVAPSEVLAVHPTQLYETGAALIIWCFGMWLLRRRVAGGAVATTVFALLAAERVLVELLRAKDDRFVGGLTLAQIISVAILIALVGMNAGRLSKNGWASRPSSKLILIGLALPAGLLTLSCVDAAGPY